MFLSHPHRRPLAVLNLTDNRHKDNVYVGFRQSNNYLITPAAPGWVLTHPFQARCAPDRVPFDTLTVGNAQCVDVRGG